MSLRKSKPVSAAPADQGLAARALAVLHDEGPRVFWIKLLSGLGVYRRLFLLERSLADPIDETASAVPLDIDLLTRDDVDECPALGPDSVRSTIVELLEAGSLCFVARHDGRAVGTCWFAPDHTVRRIPRLGATVVRRGCLSVRRLHAADVSRPAHRPGHLCAPAALLPRCRVSTRDARDLPRERVGAAGPRQERLSTGRRRGAGQARPVATILRTWIRQVGPQDTVLESRREPGMLGISLGQSTST